MKAFIINFLIFAIFRYSLPNYFLCKDIEFKTLIIVSACFAISSIVKKHSFELLV